MDVSQQKNLSAIALCSSEQRVCWGCANPSACCLQNCRFTVWGRYEATFPACAKLGHACILLAAALHCQIDMEDSHCTSARLGSGVYLQTLSKNRQEAKADQALPVCMGLSQDEDDLQQLHAHNSLHLIHRGLLLAHHCNHHMRQLWTS